MAERIKDTLARVEADLSRKVQALREELIPLERELSEVRRALAAVSPEEPPALLQFLERPASPSPYAGMTIKQLALQALREQFATGATAADLLSFIETAYDRKIDRASFSPQLSRLKEEGLVRRIGRYWRVIEKRNEPSLAGDGSFASETDVSLRRNKQSPGAG